MDEPLEKLSLVSMDIISERIEILKKIFPEVFKEGRIDFDTLQCSLGNWVDPDKERFGLNWPGKAECMKIMQQPSIGTLLPLHSESINFNTTENVIIEGENLEVLKLLQKSYYGKIKMIYIDPPYNTGNEFIYSDNFHEGLNDYLRYSGQIDSNGLKFSTNSESDGRYHSKWLNMMYPRLFLARNLLKSDGVIFVSIDDHEVNNLRALMNEIFGEENFVTQFCWKRRTGANDSKNFYVSSDHEYVLCFAKSEEFTFLGIEKNLNNYLNPDNDLRGPWMRDNLTCNKTADERPNLFYPITDPISNITYECSRTRVWAYEKNRMNRIISEGKVIFPKEKSGTPMYKRHLSELRSNRKPLSSWIGTSLVDEQDTDSLSLKFPLNMVATKQLRELLGGQFFDFPKSPKIIQELAAQVTTNDDIIFDFFAGSGTTGQGILELNKADGCNRKFLLVQLPEPIDKPPFSNIAQITRERLKRIINIFNQENNNRELGYQAYKLASSNFKIWQNNPANIENIGKMLQLFVEHVDESRTTEDILYELLLKSGYPLTASIEKLNLVDKEVYSISEGKLLICLDRNLTLEVIETLVERLPVTIICLDEGFRGNDQLKVNAVQTIKSHNRNNESSIIFRVV